MAEVLPSWLLSKQPHQKEGEPSGDEDEENDRQEDSDIAIAGASANMLRAPKALVGSAVQERHRVLQTCLGQKHGVLLTDAGIVFTWGDNRYGQLGRAPVLKEEKGQPFPVLDMLGAEVLQVASGTHHCLALAAPGFVWGWGRNKAGQLGTGDYRDRVRPVKVCHDSIANNFGEGIQLGSTGLKETGRIVTIGAGIDSSVAAAANSDVWQWGEISSNFTENLGGNNANEKAKKQLLPVVQNRPYNVFKRESFRTGMRPSRVSVTETGCRVLDKDVVSDKQRLQGLGDALRQMQETINKDRRQLAKMEEEQKRIEEAKKAENVDDGDFDELAALQDTIGVLERDLMLIERDIESYTNSLQSCDLRQAQNRSQLQLVQQQATTLSDMKDKVSLQIFSTTKGSSERRKLEDKLAEVEEFVQANKNTRMTLLEQRTETDQEKKRIVEQLGERRKQRERSNKRLDTVRDLSKSAKAGNTGASDTMSKVLQQQTTDVCEHFDRREKEDAYLKAMKVLVYDRTFLDTAEVKMKEVTESFTSSNDASRADRATTMSRLLMDFVNMERSWCQMLEDRWSRDSLDLSSFFGGARKPDSGDTWQKKTPIGSPTPKLTDVDDSQVVIWNSPDEAMQDRATPP
eukprot:CAMPEP_0197624610 /NCGR_PEP_ID=MMETSP1338-20131121/4181_1 /TAXON_ID=43686 ORGANISM="Pelagodinium beii, Strain RCC1491" /NCGR_SAMPLE_ID=MMETSP1338 /ASSEMBLY_ACC=CAM_ASM_000754 /LENGTH=629 /DNA_ID=CAMNT_0043194773 /DNA_START=52 /DNA_END=1938 /DNA_ORIENTATION=+